MCPPALGVRTAAAQSLQIKKWLSATVAVLRQNFTSGDLAMNLLALKLMLRWLAGQQLWPCRAILLNAVGLFKRLASLSLGLAAPVGKGLAQVSARNFPHSFFGNRAVTM